MPELQVLQVLLERRIVHRLLVGNMRAFRRVAALGIALMVLAAHPFSQVLGGLTPEFKKRNQSYLKNLKTIGYIIEGQDLETTRLAENDFKDRMSQLGISHARVIRQTTFYAQIWGFEDRWTLADVNLSERHELPRNGQPVAAKSWKYIFEEQAEGPNVKPYIRISDTRKFKSRSEALDAFRAILTEFANDYRAANPKK